MTDTHIRIIEKLKNKSDIELQYTSNFSIMPSEEVVNLWKQFKVVKWMASIDGVGDRFALLRWPHTWNKLQSLTERAIKETPDNVVFGVEHTLNMLNAYYYDEMEDWFYNHFCKDAPQRRGVFNLHNVIGRLSLAEIPKELREKIANKFGEDHLITKTVQNEEIKDPKYSVQYLDLLDRQRSTTWRSVFAEVENHYA